MSPFLVCDPEIKEKEICFFCGKVLKIIEGKLICLNPACPSQKIIFNEDLKQKDPPSKYK